MHSEIENAIKTLADKSAAEKSATDAMHLAQAALNLAHVAAVLEETKKRAAE